MTRLWTHQQERADPSDGGWLRERVILVACVMMFFLGGYYGIAFWASDAELSAQASSRATMSLRTTLDDAIPFWSWSVIVYAWVYPAVFLPAFVVRSPALFRRVLIAYVVVIGVSFAAFIAVPVSAVGLRPPIDSLNTAHFTEWGTALLYRLDPPCNLFPSLHLGLATLSALACWRAHRTIGGLASIALGLVAVSVCTVKQHFVADAVAGLALAFAVDALVVGSRLSAAPGGRGTVPGDAAFPVGVPGVYAGGVLVLYLVFYAVFLLGG